MRAMSEQEQRQFWHGVRLQGAGTLVSRILGMLRDVATASLLGLASGGVMDAFAIAFRGPDLIRRLLGEGAFTASFIPALAARWNESEEAGWQLVQSIVQRVSLQFGGLVLVSWLLCAGLLWTENHLSVGLIALFLPYLWFILLAAQLAATLQSLGHFTAPAWAPLMVNLLWLATAWWIAPAMTSNNATQAILLATAILIGGICQFCLQGWMVFRLGYRWQPLSPETAKALHREVRRIHWSTMPTLWGLSITHVNTFLDTAMAWLLAPSGATAALYFAERLFQFPVGLIGIALGSALLPLLSRHAARKDWKALRDDLTQALQLAFVVGMPASAGLACLAEPVTIALFQHGEFRLDDALRMAGVVRGYAFGVMIFALLPVLIRGRYALGDYRGPALWGITTVLLNIIVNGIVYSLEGGAAGMAIVTSIAAVCLCLGLLKRFTMGRVSLRWKSLGISFFKALLCSGGMAISLILFQTFAANVLYQPLQTLTSTTARLLTLALFLLVGIVSYSLLAIIFRQYEWLWLFGRLRKRDETNLP
ncbi:Hypothetical protein PBC10988_26330 [Planctomycetales bacterium 10988]|nr:Hypothetical protein PBC10988_26330 [Planctomycetales bacterium 10988]